MEKKEERRVIAVFPEVHKALRLRAAEEDKPLQDVTNEILAEVLGVKKGA